MTLTALLGTVAVLLCMAAGWVLVNRRSEVAMAGAPGQIQTVPELTPDSLKRFRVFENLPHDELLVFSEKLQFGILPAGVTLFSYGEEDTQDYLLYSGKLELATPDGKSRVIEGGSEAAGCVVSSLRPRKNTATALTPCRYIALDAQIVTALTRPSGNSRSNFQARSGEYEFEELSSIDEIERPCNNRLLDAFNADLEANRFVLATIPEVAWKIRRIINSPGVEAEHVADIISSDPVIAAKVIKAANSAFFRGYEYCNTVRDAVVRLGLKTTQQLVLCFTLRDLFKAKSGDLRSAMRDAWDHTVETSAIATVLARRTGVVEPDEAMLGGILSNIGVLSVFAWVQNRPEIFRFPEVLASVVDDLKAEVGSMVLSNWEFSPEYIQCAAQADNWRRSNNRQADLTDLVITASLHGWIGKRKVPRADQVPACRRVLGDDLTPEFALEFLSQAQQDIGTARKLIRG